MGDVVMPRLSDTMEEGTIIEWLAREGVEAGVLRIREPAGRTVPVGTVIAELA